MPLRHRTLWASLLVFVLLAASCQVSVPGLGRVVLGPSGQPTLTPEVVVEAQPTDTPAPTPTPEPTNTPQPTPSPTPEPTHTPAPALMPTPTLSLIEVTPETGWPVAPLTLALAAAVVGLTSLGAGLWLRRQDPSS